MGRAERQASALWASFMSGAPYLIDQLIQQGITHFCIAPGSRNTPLVLSIAKHPKATETIHFDERGLAFFALGYGKATKKPAALIITSGTALGNLVPAVMEAYHSHTPLLILSADRPHPLRSCSSNQTTKQTSLLTPFCLFTEEISPTAPENYYRSIAAQAATYKTGPVHLNCAFTEPFDLDPPISKGSPIPFTSPTLQPPPITTTASKGLILLGEIPTSPLPVLKLAQRLQWPLFADLLSNARSHPTPEQQSLQNLFHTPSPDYVLHIGKPLTLKHPFQIDLQVSPYQDLQDPKRTCRARLQSDIDLFAQTFEGKTDPSWLTSFPPPSQTPSLFTSIAETFPNTYYFLGNSTPIRQAQLHFFPKNPKGFFANRGLSGIDGNIATAAGLAYGLKHPLVLCIGDQTALHDLNSLSLLSKSPYPITLIILNNYGGEIFTHLPIQSSPYLSTHFQAKHSLTFEKAAALFNLPYSQTLQTAPHSQIIELETTRNEVLAL